MKILISFSLFIFLINNCLAIGTWMPSSIFSGGASDVNCSFSIGNKGYVGGGRTSLTTFKSDFWEFDPIMDAWTQISSYPAGDMCSMASFVINDKAYVGLGFNSAGYHDEFYEYDPLTNIWTPKATFGGSARYSSSWFTVGNAGYIIGGWNGSPKDDCWEYIQATDTWVQKADFPGGNRQGAIGFAINNKGYVCTGYNVPTHFNDLWQFDPINNSWTIKAPFPASPRRASAAFVINDQAYVGLGYDDVDHHVDFYKYNSTTDSWTQEAGFLGTPRYHSFNFVVNNKGYVGAGSSGNVSVPVMTDDVWIFESTGDQNLIQGHEYIDFNSNSIQDSLEPNLINKKVIESNTGNIAFTNQNGFYSLTVDDTGNYVVMPFDSINYFAPVPTDYNVNFVSTLQVDSLNDFAFQAVGVYEDLCITISPTNNFRSGMNGSYMINYSNVGNTVLNGTVVFYPDTNLTFVTSVPSPTSIDPDSIVFSIGNLTPFQSGQILVTVNVDTGLTIGTMIGSSAMILPIANDANPACNLATWDLLITGSYDPNDITVNREFIFDYQVPNQPELEYLIRFQNTGNDTAFTVRIMNTIDTIEVELNSFQFVSSSHPATITWLPAESSMRFLFNNILLADSNTNEQLSHGFIRYKIKPKTNLVVGDSITSQAFIFFDFNSAVATNIAKTDIIIPTGIQETNNAELINVYPNPAHSLLTIQIYTNELKNISLELYNIFGQKIQDVVYEKNSGKFSNTIDISELTSGVYFIKIPETNAVKKFVKY